MGEKVDSPYGSPMFGRLFMFVQFVISSLHPTKGRTFFIPPLDFLNNHSFIKKCYHSQHFLFSKSSDTSQKTSELNMPPKNSKKRVKESAKADNSSKHKDSKKVSWHVSFPVNIIIHTFRNIYHQYFPLL